MPYNYYPNAYQPYSYFPQQQSGMLWVSNEQEAMTYPVAPNNAVALWDSSKKTVYVKQADASGKPIIKIMDYTERSTGDSAGESNNTSYATKDEIEGFSSEIAAIKNDLKNIKKELKKRAIDDDDE